MKQKRSEKTSTANLKRSFKPSLETGDGIGIANRLQETVPNDGSGTGDRKGPITEFGPCP